MQNFSKEQAVNRKISEFRASPKCAGTIVKKIMLRDAFRSNLGIQKLLCKLLGIHCRNSVHIQN
jgi:hypothetical protein